jgi:small-conductance mechanosensitive channel
VGNEASSSAVTWGAVIAGAFVAAALALALLSLGTGIGLSAVSPWTNAGASAAAIGWAAIAWLIAMQLISSSVGGYVAGRLRTKWVNVHTHEVYFRDTAHGFLVWAVGLVITAAFLTSAATSLVGGAGTAAVAAGSVEARDGVGANGYVIDTMLRTNGTAPERDNGPVRGEMGLIFVNTLRAGAMPPADRAYLAQVVAARTGVTQTEAEKRVDEAYAQAKQSADAARKAVAHSMYWTFLALLIGAFCASFAATVGGRQRDLVPAL